MSDPTNFHVLNWQFLGFFFPHEFHRIHSQQSSCPEFFEVELFYICIQNFPEILPGVRSEFEPEQWVAAQKNDKNYYSLSKGHAKQFTKDKNDRVNMKLVLFLQE